MRALGGCLERVGAPTRCRVRARVGQEFPFSANVTFFGPVDGGNCSFGVIPENVSPFLRVAAVGTPLYAGSEPCGRFIEIDTTGASCAAPPCDFTGERVVVMISDQLVSAAPDLDLSEVAFAQIAHVDEGILLNVHWRYVPGTHAGHIELHHTPGINPNFIHFVLQKHNFGIAEVWVRDAVDPTWHSAARDSANQWSVTTGQTFVAPLSIRLTDVEGRTLTSIDAVGSLAPSSVHDLGVQFGPLALVSTGLLAGPLTALAMAALGGFALRRRRGLTSMRASAIPDTHDVLTSDSAVCRD